jgi:hypothetical protein
LVSFCGYINFGNLICFYFHRLFCFACVCLSFSSIYLCVALISVLKISTTTLLEKANHNRWRPKRKMKQKNSYCHQILIVKIFKF